MEVSGQLHTPVSLPRTSSVWYVLDENQRGDGYEKKNLWVCQESDTGPTAYLRHYPVLATPHIL
jgi:hypothetical protein